MNDMSEEAVKEPQITVELSKLDKRAEVIEELTNALIDRLGPVTRPHCPDPKSSSEDCPQLVELAERIFGVERRISTVADSLQNLLDRIEL